MNKIKNKLTVILVISLMTISCKQKTGSDQVKEQDASRVDSTLVKKEEKKTGTPDLGPNFNPIGPEIAYYSYVDGAQNKARIFISDLDGGNLREVSTLDSIGFHTEPKWSRDGKKIAYTNFVDDGAKIMAVTTDGNSLEELAKVTENGFHMFTSWDLSGEGYFFFHWPKEGFTPDAYYAKGGKVERLTENGRTNRPHMTESGKLYVNRIDDLENYVVTKQLFDLKTKSTLDIPKLEGEFITGGHAIKSVENEDSTTLILEDLEGNDLKELGIVPYKGIMFTTIDKDLKHVAYNTSFEEGAEIHLLEISSGEIIKLTEN